MRYPANSFFLSTIGKRFTNPNAMYIELQFDSNPIIEIEKAPLLYDKQLALSFRLADGYRDAFVNSFAVLFGRNSVDAEGNTHDGFNYTDGCGNDVPFTIDFSPIIYESTTRHDETATYWMRWSDFQKAVDFGHGLLFHGYEDTPPVDSPYNDYLTNLQAYREMSLRRWGFDAIVATAPNGEHEWYDLDNKAAFFEAGYKLINLIQQPVGGAVAGIPYTVPITEGINFNTITSSWFNIPHVYPGLFNGKHIIEYDTFEDLPEIGQPYILYMTGVYPNGTNYRWDTTLNAYYVVEEGGGSSVPIADIYELIDEYANKPYATGLNITTHQVSYEPDQNDLEGMNINYFKDMVTHFEALYGKSGTDQILFAGAGAVMDYIYTRENITINKYYESNKVIIEIIPTDTSEIRRPSLTLKINSNIAVKNVQIHNIDKFSQNVLNETNGIVNLEWSSEHYALADKFLTTAEDVKTQASVDMAFWFIDRITEPIKRNSLLTRWNNIVVLSDITYLIEFGRSIYLSSSPPFNNISSASTDISTYLPTDITIRDNGGSDNGLKLSILNAFSTMIYAGINTGNNSGIYPDSAMRDSFESNAGTTSRIKLSGLPVAKNVDFKFFFSRNYTSGIKKIPMYRVFNNLTPENITFDKNITLDGSNNSTTVAEISNAIVNDDGELYLEISVSTGTSAGISVLEFIVKV